MKNQNLNHPKTGYGSNDAMVHKARHFLGPELTTKPRESIDSKSAADRSTLRPYKKGGCAKAQKDDIQKERRIPRHADDFIRQKIKDERLKMAMGGVGKIRHKAATTKGAPASRRMHRTVQDR
jgi:hypothetical protein